MKSVKSSILVFGIAVLSSCAANHSAQKAKIISDCTGSYLRIDGKDYLVCNTDKLKNFSKDATVEVTFEKIDKCPEFDGKVVCMMYHENEGLIRINTIK